MGKRPSFYERRIFPWLNDTLTSDPELVRIRAEALSSARGRVIEIGFGSGPNLALYPAAVESVVAIEPNEGMRDRAVQTIRTSRMPVELIVGRAEDLPFPDNAFDTAVSMLTLCSVSGPARALAELHRVLTDDGRIIVLEHGLSPDPGVARWQRRLNPIQKVIGCGCHLDRDMASLLERQGFRTEQLHTFYAPKIPRTHGWLTVGTATRARDPGPGTRGLGSRD